MYDLEFLTLAVRFDDRADGGLRATSEDMPGLILSNADKKAVVDGVPVAIKAILEHQGFQDVSVKHSKSLAEIINGDNPQHVDMHVQHFVVELRQVA